MWFRMRMSQPTKWHSYDPTTGTGVCGMVRSNVLLGMNAVTRKDKPADKLTCRACIRHLATYTPHRPDWMAASL